MATIDSAKAFGIDDILGSIEQGKKADIILIDTYKPHLYPLNMPVDRVTYFANGNDVDTVIVDGKILMKNRRVTTINEEDVLENAQIEIEAAVGRSKLEKLYDITSRYWGKSRF
jgi:cytosine/adenosine deaminase-related metal-dependent hydrolase